MKQKSPRLAMAMLVALGCLPFVTSGCGDDGTGSDPGTGGTASSQGGTGASAGKGNGNAGKGGNATAGTNTGGTKAYAGSTGEGGDGGDDSSSSGGSSGAGGKGGAGGTAGAGGGGGKGGTAGAAGNGGAGGKGGAGGMSGNAGASGGGAGGTSGGTGGGGSGGGTSKCGNGVVDAGEVCDPEDGKYTEDDCGAVWGLPTEEVNGSENACQLITSTACLTCEEQSECVELLNSGLAAGNATAGPAMGTPRSVLYNEMMDCARDTNCAAGLVVDCYCGTASGAQCDAGNGNGKCRTVIERGVETTAPADVQARLTSVLYGAGVAMARLQCDLNNCLDACFPAPPQP